MFGNFKSLLGGRLSATTGPSSPANRASASPALHAQTISDVQPREPPLVTVTSDLPEYGGAPSPSPERTSSAHHTPTQHIPGASGGPSSATPIPGRSRIEVVLNPSPHRPPPGHRLWQEADLDDPADELIGPDVHHSPSAKRRKITPGSAYAITKPATAGPPTGKRGRGRPKGWRKPTALDEHGNSIPSAPKPTSGPAKRRGRPPRAPSPTARQVWERMAPPTYVSFLCEWTGCKAELQNAETLRRHVRKVHGPGRKGQGVVCRWGKCGRAAVPSEEKVLMKDEFHEHTETRHMVPLVWHVGDGVRNELCLLQATGKEDQIPAYLRGADGKQVTPWVKYQVEEDKIARLKNRNKLREILIQRDANAPLAEEDEEDKEVSAPTPPYAG